jgi:predicted ATPase
MGAPTLKRARVNDYWRRWLKNPPESVIHSITASGVINLPGSEIVFKAPITALAGLNGVGKTTLLRLLQIGIHRPCREAPFIIAPDNQEAVISLRTYDRDRGLLSTVVVTRDGTIAVPEEAPFPLVWVDSAFEVPALAGIFAKERNLEELLAQSACKELDGEALSIRSAIVGRNYTKISVYELEDFAGRETCPYFRVECGAQQYGTEGMGLGEMAIHYVMWAVDQIQRGGVLLIEEPENYIGYRAQGTLIDYIAKICGEKAATTILTTHSPVVLERIPLDHTILVVRHEGVVKMFSPENLDTRSLALGILPARSSKKDGGFVVEDRTARVFADAWLTETAGDLIDSYKVIDIPGGAGEVLTLLDKFPSLPGWFSVVGLLDGDERDKREQQSGLAFLPGNEPPEVLMQSVILSHWRDVAGSLSVAEADMMSVLSSLEGLDHHDWFIELQKRIRVSFEALVQAAVRHWLSVAQNKVESDLSLSLIRRIVGP